MQAYITYQITTCSPVLISDYLGNPNAIATETAIPGGSIRGMLASQFIREHDLGSQAHTDSTFQHLFLQQNALYGYAYPVIPEGGSSPVACPTSLALRQHKTNREKVFNTLAPAPDMPPTRNPQQYADCSEGTVRFHQPETQVQFHHARSDRLKGRSTEGEIFTYESLASGQTFIGVIAGDPAELQTLIDWFGTERVTVYIGRSKTAEYGKCTFQIDATLHSVEDMLPAVDAFKDNKIPIELISPAIVPNTNGFATVQKPDLERAFNSAVARTTNREDLEVTITNMRSRKQPAESFVGVWNHKTPLAQSYAPGTTLELQFNTIPDDLLQAIVTLGIAGIGLRTNEGYGQFRLVPALQQHSTFTAKDSFGLTAEKPTDPPKKTAQNICIHAIAKQYDVTLKNSAITYGHSFKVMGQHKPIIMRLYTAFQRAHTAEELDRSLADVFAGEMPEHRDNLVQGIHNNRETLKEILFQQPKGFLKEEGVKQTSAEFDRILRAALEIGFSGVDTDEEFLFQRYRQFMLTALRIMLQNTRKSKSK